MDANTLTSNLAYFTGTEAYHRWSPLSNNVLTDGCHYLAENAGAYWLFDAIDSHINGNAKALRSGFVMSHLKVLEVLGTKNAVLTITDGNEKIIAKQDIDFTDFPLPSIKLFSQITHEGFWVHMLVSEY